VLAGVLGLVLDDFAGKYVANSLRSSTGNRALLMRRSCFTAFFEEMAFPSGVTGPRDTLPSALDAQKAGGCRIARRA
jgi:hypothetical protein